MKLWLKENWFKVSILFLLVIFVVVFLFLFSLFVVERIQKHNYFILEAALVCNNHRVEQEWQKCIDGFFRYYIGSSPKFRFPY